MAELLRDSLLAMLMRYAHLAPDHRLAAGERMGVALLLNQQPPKKRPPKDYTSRRGEWISGLELVGAAGIEPATVGLEIRCSIRLSYAPSTS